MKKTYENQYNFMGNHVCQPSKVNVVHKQKRQHDKHLFMGYEKKIDTRLNFNGIYPSFNLLC